MEPWWNSNDSALYAVSRGSDVTANYGSIIIKISLATGTSRTLVHLQNGKITYSPRTAYYENHVYVMTVMSAGERQVLDFDLGLGRAKIIFQKYEDIGSLTASRNGMRIAYIGQDNSHPPDVWVAEKNFAFGRRLTRFNPNIEGRVPSEVQTVSWQARGAASYGTLLLPANYHPGHRYPMITYIYPSIPLGIAARSDFGFLDVANSAGFFLPLFAKHGYAVFFPDSTIHMGSPMRDIADGILSGVDKVVAMGIADPRRLGICGHSYGGYSTLSLIVQTHRFKAAVVSAGLSNLITLYSDLSPDGRVWTGWAESGQGAMGGTPWRYRERYIENSPFFYLDRVQTPVLLEYGSSDIGGVTRNMRDTFVALRRLGKTATLIGYVGEGHVLSKPSNQIDFMNRVLDWFGKYLMP